MKKFEPGQAVVFALVLFFIWGAVHNILKILPQAAQNNPVPAALPVQQAQNPQPVPPPAPAVVKIWPGGSPATKVVYIPDSKSPAKGLMEITLSQSDDLELHFEPLWVFETTDWFQGAQGMIDDGSGFITLNQYQDLLRTSDQDGTNAFWMKARTLRLRLMAGQPTTTYSFTVDKKEIPKPMAPILPQNFGDLSITFDSLQALSQARVIIYLTFQNKSQVNTIAVALQDYLCMALPCDLQTSLVFSDGTQYVTDTSELSGINGMDRNPRQLTSIEPGQELKTSITFISRGLLSETVNSAKLQTQVVVNGNFRSGEYDNYNPTRQSEYPTDCKVVNAIFDTPIKMRKE